MEENMENVTREQEQEIINILIDSSLYLEMSQADRRSLIRYLVILYFHPHRLEANRPLPRSLHCSVSE